MQGKQPIHLSDEQIAQLLSLVVPMETLTAQYTVAEFIELYTRIGESISNNENCRAILYGDIATKARLKPFAEFFYVYCDELKPLKLLLQSRFFEKTAVNAQFTGILLDEAGNQQPFDAIIYTGNGEERIEFSLAIDGHQQALSIEHIAKYGHAPGGVKFIADGTKHNRHIREHSIVAVHVGQTTSVISSLIEKAIANKLKQKYHGTSLGILFDDIIVKDDESRFISFIEEVVRKHKKQIFSVFKRVFFIGTYGKLLLSASNVKPYKIMNELSVEPAIK